MASQEIRPEDVSDWLTPSEAASILKAAFDSDYLAKGAPLERLRGGMVRAIAHATAETDNGVTTRDDRIASIGQVPWARVDEDDAFWKTGDVTIEIWEGSGYYRNSKTIRLYKVRFEPASVRDILPPDRAVSEASEAKSAPEAPRKGPRVTDPDLEAWYELYMRVYGGTPEDTEDNAVESALGMFQGKSVARDRVRKLRGSQKRGPKGPRNSG